MLIPGMIQALTGAFSFGILINAASAGFVLLLRSHGSRSSLSGPRLALVTFLASSALWAQVGFLTTVLNTTATTACQATTVILVLLDQIARVSIEQNLLWVLASKRMKSMSVLIPQLLILARFIAGIVLVAETRPQFKPTCIPVSNSLPLALAIITLDAVILTTLLTKGYFWKKSKAADACQAYTSGKAVFVTLGGLAIWMGTSVTLLLGLRSVDLIFRTALPAIGLSILVSIVTVLAGQLSAPRGTPSELLSPQNEQGANAVSVRDVDTADSGYPPSRYEDLKGSDTYTFTAFATQHGPPRREVSGSNNGLPLISRPVTGLIGVGGMPIEGQLFPPLRSNPPLKISPSSQPQPANNMSSSPVKSKGIFDRSKNDREVVNRTGKFSISNPIPVDSTEMQIALNKVSTVDLATAARNEKTRREMQAQESMDLIAKRPAPQPPSIPLEEAVKRATSTKRKIVPSRSSSETSQSTTTGGLSIEVNASSTATQFSPGVEDLRRRSPRQPIAPNMANVRSVMSNGSVRIPIARSPSAPRSRTTIGVAQSASQQSSLPRNLPVVRSSGSKKFPQTPGGSAQQTVMLIHGIEYDDPNTVNDIIQEASRTPKSASMPLDLHSVIHRPRPIPRKSERDRQVFPAELSPGTPGHRRSRSGSSIHSRRSALQSEAGSPVQLPPLPVPSSISTSFSRPRPPTRKVMTHGEAMSLLLPQSPMASASTMSTKRRSSVPTIPPVPSPFLREHTSSSTGEGAGSFPGIQIDNRHSQSTVFTDRSSIRTESIFGTSESIQEPTNNSNLSISSKPNDSRQAPLSAIGYSKADQLVLDGTNRKSSPIIPASRFSAYSGVEDDEDQDQDAEKWEPTHPPIAPPDPARLQMEAKTTPTRKESGRSNVSSTLSRNGDEVMTIMLDTFAEKSVLDCQPLTQNGREHWLLAPQNDRLHPGQWHRRVGERPLSFINRSENTMKARKMPPPSPLLLNGSYKENIVPTLAPSPSPLESPEAAYQLIQAQLRRLEQLQMSPGQSDNMALLQDLEEEMGQQEKDWQAMHMNFERDSLSTLKSSPGTDSRPTTTDCRRAKYLKANLAEYRASRRSRLFDRDAFRPKHDDDFGLASSQASLVPRIRSSLGEPSGNQQGSGPHGPGLATGTPAKKSTYVVANRVAAEEAASDKTPKTESLRPDMTPAHEAATLWQPKSAGTRSVQGALWTVPPMNHEPSNTLQLLIHTSVRSRRRKVVETQDEIESFSLWTKPSNPKKHSQNSGLWVETHIQTSQQSRGTAFSRPTVVQRPRRTTRRTTLPDILENPEPTPDNRGTFLFRFPWGEKSEHPSVQARPSKRFMAMPGTMTTGVPRITTSPQPLPNAIPPSESSPSSVFEEYEDELSDYNGEDDDFSESDGDDFDETTIWEIASLLKTEQILPSKNSLLPPPLENPFGDEYMSELLSDTDESEVDVHAIDQVEAIAKESMQSTYSLSSGSPQIDRSRSSLWVATPTMPRPHQYGLPQPDGDIWRNLVANDGVMLMRSRPRLEELEVIESRSLWIPTDKHNTEEAVPFWLTPSAALKHQHGVHRTASTPLSTARVEPPSCLLWKQPIIGLPQKNDAGLFSLESCRLDLRTTAAEPAALQVMRRPRGVESAPSRLQSSRLWALEETSGTDTDWLSISSLQCRSLLTGPSAYTSSSASHLYQASRIPLRRQYRNNFAYRQDWNRELREAITSSYPGTCFALRYATEAEWTAALYEAIEAGRHIPRSTCRTASPKDWAAALHEARSAKFTDQVSSCGCAPMKGGEAVSRRGQETEACEQEEQKRVFDASKRHPVFAASSLVIDGTEFHPAATGYTYDVTSTHPIFFGSVVSLTGGLGGDVHPAMASYLLPRAKRSGLWASTMATESHSSTSTSHTTAYMWIPPLMAADAVPSSALPRQGDRVDRHRLKKSSVVPAPMVLATDFGKQGLWRRSNVQQKETDRDWLEDSMKKRFSRIDFRY